ncbi:MAG: HAMP domain-containing histidine kinase [Anaerolineae bacterium]|nr:HAMP domain-containing histidine kinase [Anaerolineae bacterium]
MPAVILSEYVPSVVIDPYGEIYDMNAEAEKLLGDSRVNLVNKPWDRPLQDGAVIDMDGRSVQLSIMKTTLASYVMLKDLSVCQQAATQAVEIDRLQGDLKKSQELLAVKEKFTALIAHDFGTPITGIRLQNDILKNHLGSLSQESITQRLEQMNVHLNHMVDLLDDLLLLSQIHGPQGGESSAPFHLEVFCRKIIDQIKRGWKGREVILTCTGEMDNVQVDRRLVRYILSNLVGNALKYSPEGGDVQVNLDVTEQAINFFVSDEGIGIPADELDKIFTQFYRASNVNEFSGLGLGLTMMRTCIEMCGGTIKVESKLDEGTTFVVTLPRCNG